MRMVNIFPPMNELLELEAEEIAPFLLEYLNQEEDDPMSSKLNRYNMTLDTNSALQEYAQGNIAQVAKVITEAWVWLEKEGFLAPMPNQTGEFVFITRKGKKLRKHSDFNAYRFSNLLPTVNLDPTLSQKVRPLFIRGDYDTAVFQSFKEVEVRIRKACGYSDDIYGTELARKAFHPDTGPLTNMSKVKSERDSIMHLFSGAIGALKNPSSHRDVDFENPSEVAEIILFANYLLRVIDSRTPETTLKRYESEQAIRP